MLATPDIQSTVNEDESAELPSGERDTLKASTARCSPGRSSGGNDLQPLIRIELVVGRAAGIPDRPVADQFSRAGGGTEPGCCRSFARCCISAATVS